MRTRAEMKKDAKSQLKGNKGKAALLVLITGAISFIPNVYNFIMGNEILSYILQVAVIIYSSLLAVGAFLFYSAIRDRKEATVDMLFSGSEHYVKVFCVSLLAGIITFVGMILLIIPGIIFSLMYSQAVYICIDNPEIGVIEALKTSRLAMKGYKGKLFVLNLSFIGWALLSILTLGILFLYVTPYMQLTLVNFYSDLMADYKLNGAAA
ncbi:MAG: DUF975 family protein [Clostridium sp.]